MATLTTTLTLQNMKSVLNHVDDLNVLLNVNEERTWLEQFLNPNDVEECINSGYTNLERMESLCIKMVERKCLELFNGLRGLLMERQKRFLHVYNVFTSGKCDHGECDHNDIRPTSSFTSQAEGNENNVDSSTLFQIQSKIKAIDEDLQLLRSTALKQTIDTAKHNPTLSTLTKGCNLITNAISYANPPPQQQEQSLFQPYTRDMLKSLKRYNYKDWRFSIDEDDNDVPVVNWQPTLRAWSTMVEVIRFGMNLDMWYSLILPAKLRRHFVVVRLFIYGSSMDVYTSYQNKDQKCDEDALNELSYSVKVEVPLFKETRSTENKTWTFEKEGKTTLEFFETLWLKVHDIPWGMFSDDELPSLTIRIVE